MVDAIRVVRSLSCQVRDTCTRSKSAIVVDDIRISMVSTVGTRCKREEKCRLLPIISEAAIIDALPL